MGTGVIIEDNVLFSRYKDISIGNNTEIHRHCCFYGDVTIGNDVMIAERSTFITHNHKFDDIHIPIRNQGFTAVRPIVIGDDVWIGWDCVVLPGVIIGRGCVIDAKSVVIKSIPAYTVACGNLAKVIKSRLLHDG